MAIKPSLIDFFLVAAGWVYEIGTVSVGIIDVVSDVLVAWQFFSDGHDFWGYLVAASIFISSLALTFVATCTKVTFSRSDYPKLMHPFIHAVNFFLQIKPPWIKFAVIFPIAQLIPLTQWALESFKIKSAPGTNTAKQVEEIGMGEREPSDLINAELEAGNRSREHVMNAFAGGVANHMQAHGMLYVEAVIESVPQCIIQLLAMTSLDEVSNLQLLSLMLSLSSIISKGYILSLSYDLRPFIFRFSLFAHDMFSMFYVFSSILSVDEPKDYTAPWMFGGFATSYLSSWWSFKVSAVGVTFAVLVIGFGLLMLLDEIRNVGLRKLRKHMGPISAISCGFLIVYVPLVLALEGFKLTILSAAFLFNEPEMASYPGFAKLFSFVYDSQREEEDNTRRGYYDELVLGSDKRSSHTDTFMGRYSYVIYSYATLIEGRALKNMIQDIHKRGRAGKTISGAIGGGIDNDRKRARAARIMARPHPDSESEPIWTDCQQHEASGVLDQYLDETKDHDLNELQLHQKAKEYKRLSKPLGVYWALKFKNPFEDVRKKVTNRKEIIMGILGAAVLILEAVSVLFSICYPFLHAASVSWATLNILQRYCLVGVFASLVVSALFFNVSWTYLRFNFDIASSKQTNNKKVIGLSVSEARNLVKRFFRPPNAYILLNSVDGDVIPGDVSTLVADFLPDNGLAVGKMTIREAHNFKKLD